MDTKVKNNSSIGAEVNTNSSMDTEVNNNNSKTCQKT